MTTIVTLYLCIGLPMPVINAKIDEIRSMNAHATILIDEKECDRMPKPDADGFVPDEVTK